MKQHYFSLVSKYGYLMWSGWANVACGLIAMFLFSLLWVTWGRPGHKRFIAISSFLSAFVVAIQQITYALDGGTIIREHGGDYYELDWGTYLGEAFSFVFIYLALAKFLNLRSQQIFFGAALIFISRVALLFFVLSLSEMQYALLAMSGLAGAANAIYTILNSRTKGREDMHMSLRAMLLLAFAYIGWAVYMTNTILGHGFLRVWDSQRSNVAVENGVHFGLNVMFKFFLGLMLFYFYCSNEKSHYTFLDRVMEREEAQKHEYLTQRAKEIDEAKDYQPPQKDIEASGAPGFEEDGDSTGFSRPKGMKKQRRRRFK